MSDLVDNPEDRFSQNEAHFISSMTFTVPVQVSIAEASLGKAHITGGGLPGKYIAAQLHFHWGKDHSQGSEHTFRGRSYPLEVCDFSTLPILSFACV